MTTSRTLPPTASQERALGPDLARGAMLLLIALANSHYFLTAPSVLGGYPQDGSAVDAALAWTLATFVDARAFPLFGLLFGYGVAQVARRQAGRGPRGVRRLLWRRSLALVVLGFLHAVLLYAGDILAAYGVLLLLGAWTVGWRDRWLLVVAGLFFALNALPGSDAATLLDDPPDAAMLAPDLLTQLVERASTSVFVALVAPIGFACPFLVGLWAGRRRWLERPEEHRTLLRVVAVVGIGVAVVGAQPFALVVSGAVALPAPEVLEVVVPLHDASGVLGGFGYAALFALLAGRLSSPSYDGGGRSGVGSRLDRVVGAVAAVGQRSMSCYVAQSVVWTVVFTPYLLGLAGPMTVSSTAVLATVTWLATVLLADAARRHGRRGPLEVLVRRVTYGPPSGPAVGWSRSVRGSDG